MEFEKTMKDLRKNDFISNPLFEEFLIQSYKDEISKYIKKESIKGVSTNDFIKNIILQANGNLSVDTPYYDLYDKIVNSEITQEDVDSTIEFGTQVVSNTFSLDDAYEEFLYSIEMQKDVHLDDISLTNVHGTIFTKENGEEKEYLLIPRMKILRDVKIGNGGFESEDVVGAYLIEVADDKLNLLNTQSVSIEDVETLIKLNNIQYREDDEKNFKSFVKDTPSFELFKGYLNVNTGVTSEKNIKVGKEDSLAIVMNNDSFEVDVYGKHYTLGYHDFMKYSEDMSYNINNVPMIDSFDYFYDIENNYNILKKETYKLLDEYCYFQKNANNINVAYDIIDNHIDVFRMNFEKSILSLHDCFGIENEKNLKESAIYGEILDFVGNGYNQVADAYGTVDNFKQIVRDFYTSLNNKLSQNENYPNIGFKYDESIYENATIDKVFPTKLDESISNNALIVFLNDFTNQIAELKYDYACVNSNYPNKEEFLNLSFGDKMMKIFEGSYLKTNKGVKELNPFVSTISNCTFNGKTDVNDVCHDFFNNQKNLSASSFVTLFNESLTKNLGDFRSDCLNNDVKIKSREGKNIVEDYERVFDESKLGKEREIIRDYIISDIDFANHTDEITTIQSAYKKSLLSHSKEESFKLLEAYLNSKSNEEIRELFNQEKGNYNTFFQLTSTSYEDIMKKKINSLNEDNNFFDMFYLQKDGERLDIRVTYIDDDTYNFDVIKNSTKEKMMDTMSLSKDTLEDVITTNEDVLKNKEFNRRENLPWFINESKTNVYMSRYDGQVKKGEENLSRREKILRSLNRGETIVLSNLGATGTSRECIMFQKGENGILMKTFKNNSPTVRVSECIMSSNDINFEEEIDGTKVYKVPFGGVRNSKSTVELSIRDSEIDIDNFNKILSGMNESKWFLKSTNEINLKNNGLSTKDISKNDRAAFNFYKKQFLTDKTISNDFIEGKLSSDLRFGVNDANNISTKTRPSTSYCYEVTYPDGVVRKRLINFTQQISNQLGDANESFDENKYIRINIIDTFFDANGNEIGFNIESVKDAFIWDGNEATINPLYEDYTSMIIKDITNNESQLYKTKEFNVSNDPLYNKDSLGIALTNITEFAKDYRFGMSDWDDIYHSIDFAKFKDENQLQVENPKLMHNILNKINKEHPGFATLDKDEKDEILNKEIKTVYQFAEQINRLATAKDTNELLKMASLPLDVLEVVANDNNQISEMVENPNKIENEL